MAWKLLSATGLAATTLGLGAMLHAQQPPAQPSGGSQDHVAALKQSLQQGIGLARKYEWIETTTISLKGDPKAKKQNRCYYGADGKVQKISLDQPEPQAQDQGRGGRGGLRGGGRVKEQIVENKKDQMKEDMENAAALVHQYVPPDAQRIQAAKDAGRIAVNPQPGRRRTSRL